MQEHRCTYTDGFFSSSSRIILEGQAERNGEVGEILSGAWEQYQREKWNTLFQETKIALAVSVSSTFSDRFSREGKISILAIYSESSHLSSIP